MLKKLISAFFLVLVFTGCKNDLHVNAPYKEMPSVFAVLNPQDEVQTIRINKVFLGEGDAHAMAKVADSVNYPEGQLEVTLTRFDGDQQVDATPEGTGAEKRTILFTETVITNVQDGDFSTTQRLYVTDKKLFTTGKYKLTIKNKHTGNVFTARANAMDSLKPKNMIFPPLLPEPQYLYPATTPLGEYVDYSSYPGNIRFIPDGIAKIYQLKIRTHFLDSSGAPNRYDFVDYEFGTRDEKTKTLKGSLYLLETFFSSADYWNAVGVALSKKNLSNNIYGRRAYMIQYFVYSSTQEYLDFLLYNSPSFAITQNSLIYSNFDDKAAIGIFTFRTRYSVRKQPASTMVNEFARNPNTCPYRFYDSQGKINFSCQ